VSVYEKKTKKTSVSGGYAPCLHIGSNSQEIESMMELFSFRARNRYVCVGALL
jgi:hypothetical protein